MCVRDRAIIRQSEPLQHFFDCPFQFAAVPEHTNATDYAEVPSGCLVRPPKTREEAVLDAYSAVRAD